MGLESAYSLAMQGNFPPWKPILPLVSAHTVVDAAPGSVLKSVTGAVVLYSLVNGFDILGCRDGYAARRRVAEQPRAFISMAPIQATRQSSRRSRPHLAKPILCLGTAECVSLW
jgi:hypothetical protein